MVTWVIPRWLMSTDLCLVLYARLGVEAYYLLGSMISAQGLLEQTASGRVHCFCFRPYYTPMNAM
jgi:hypothetical protein